MIIVGGEGECDDSEMAIRYSQHSAEAKRKAVSANEEDICVEIDQDNNSDSVRNSDW